MNTNQNYGSLPNLRKRIVHDENVSQALLRSTLLTLIDAQMERITPAEPQSLAHPSMAIGSWLSAALDDPKVCEEMKRDIRLWMDAGQPIPTSGIPAGHKNEAPELYDMQYSQWRSRIRQSPPSPQLYEAKLQELERRELIRIKNDNLGDAAGVLYRLNAIESTILDLRSILNKGDSHV